MTGKAQEAAELIHKLISSGMFPALRLAMHQFRDYPTNETWRKVARHSPPEVRELFVSEKLPAPDGYNAHDKPMWTSTTLAKHLGIRHAEIVQIIEDEGLGDQCSIDQIVNLLN